MKAATHTNKFQILPFLISLMITLAIGYVASVVTRPEIPEWYNSLQKPSFNPPNWVFPVAWTVLYVLIASSAYLVWKRRDNGLDYYHAKLIYIMQLTFNFSWSIIFFGAHQILAALIVIVLLWVCIVINMYCFARVSKTACWLLLPYLLWVSFAVILNASIYLLNA